MKIVFLDTDTLGDVDSLDQFNEYGEVFFYPFTQLDERLERVLDADVVFTNKVLIDQYIIDNCPQLKFVGVLATGTNNVDLDYAASKGIEVKNVSGYSTESVAQHTFSLLLALIHQTAFYSNYVSEQYSDSPIFTHLSRPYFELKGKVMGIIGLGNIGRRVAYLAEAFGMKVCYYSTSGKNTTKDYQQLSFVDLLRTSDVISIHAPLNDNTISLIGNKELLLMKKSAFLLNNGRGGIVNEKELFQALENQQIAGAALDVFQNEPLEKESLLHIKKDNLILSPHIAWASLEARNELMRLSLENLKSFLKK